MDGPDFEAFYRLEFARMVSVAAALTGDLALAEDIAQEALWQAERRWRDVSVLDRPGAWVRRVTVNRAISQLRRRSLERAVLGRAAVERDWACAAGTATIALADEEVLRAVRRLPLRQRAAVVLTYLEDLPQAEVAEILGCAVGTVKAHLAKARLTLARELAATRRDVQEGSKS